jgi:hypothetical protein
VKTKPDFTAFASARSLSQPVQVQSTDTKHLQVRMLRSDAARLRRIAEERGQTIQSVLVEAVNLYLRDHNESPASDPGTTVPKQPSS